MGYSSDGPRPFERASRAQHQHIINDKEVQDLIGKCWLPPLADNISFESLLIKQEPISSNPVEFVIAVDGGYTETFVRTDFPSASIAFFQFGALLFKQDELRRVTRQSFIDPTDMARLKNLERLKLALPTKNIRIQPQSSLNASIRFCIYDFFLKQKVENRLLIETLAWFIFRRYKSQKSSEDQVWHLAQNPHTGEGVDLNEKSMQHDYTFQCPSTGEPIFLTDVFRLHEVIDEEHGASGILGYLTNAIEHLILIHLIHQLLLQQPSLLKNVLFIKDGPTGFFGQTANLHKPMRDLVDFLFKQHTLLLIGLEKSGAFVEHARQIGSKMPSGYAVLLSNEYIYKYIIPGIPDSARPYGSTTNYGHKIIFKTSGGQMHVVSIPTCDIKPNPTVHDLPNLNVLLANVEALHCDMYDSALIPVALVNNLVSLADHPSSRILTHFASSGISR